MKKLLISFILFISIHSLVQSQSFVGMMVIETENFEIGEKSTIQCYVKYPYCKMDINSVAKEGNAQYTLYFDNQKSDVIMLSGGTRTIIPMSSIPLNKYTENILIAIPTQKTQMIAGYTTTEVNLKSTNAAIICQVASELNVALPSVLNSRGIIKALQENSITGTPIDIMVKDLSGKSLYAQKVLSVQAKDLDDKIFLAE
jgi:hypothetical protein